MVIGLTGKYCAGKNAVADVLASRGWRVIDEDAIGHQALAAQRDRLVAEFSAAVLDSTGSISRKELGRVVFASPAALERLEAIVHPWMVAETRRTVEAGGDSVINAAILFKMGLHEMCDTVIMVKALSCQRILRCMRRDHLSFLRIIRRLRAQRGLNRVGKDVDIHTVWNTGSRRRLRRRVERILKQRSQGS